MKSLTNRIKALEHLVAAFRKPIPEPPGFEKFMLAYQSARSVRFKYGSEYASSAPAQQRELERKLRAEIMAQAIIAR